MATAEVIDKGNDNYVTRAYFLDDIGEQQPVIGNICHDLVPELIKLIELEGSRRTVKSSRSKDRKNYSGSSQTRSGIYRF